MRVSTGLILLGLLPALAGCSRGGGGSNANTLNASSASTNSSSKKSFKYSPGDASYSIVYPGQPKEQPIKTDTVIGPIISIFASLTTNSGKRLFLSSSAVYPIASKNYNVKKGLDNSRDVGAKNLNATITREKEIDYKGVPGKEVEMSVPGGSKAKSRMYIDNSGPKPIVYQAMVTDSSGDLSTPDVDAFLSSIELKAK